MSNHHKIQWAKWISLGLVALSMTIGASMWLGRLGSTQGVQGDDITVIKSDLKDIQKTVNTMQTDVAIIKQAVGVESVTYSAGSTKEIP